MTDNLLKHIESWHDFYVVVGGGSAALTGLLFVIVSLGPHVVAGRRRDGVRAFISPVAAHFTYVFVISGLMLVPELPMPFLGVVLAAGGLGGIVFTAWTRAHQRWRAGNLPALDWVWFVALPYACFAMMLLSGAAIAMNHDLGLYAIGSTTLLFIVTGIRNAWDLVLWVAQQPRPEVPVVVADTKAKARAKRK
jgi:modulator of FtsH protease